MRGRCCGVTRAGRHRLRNSSKSLWRRHCRPARDFRHTHALTLTRCRGVSPRRPWRASANDVRNADKPTHSRLPNKQRLASTASCQTGSRQHRRGWDAEDKMGASIPVVASVNAFIPRSPLQSVPCFTPSIRPTLILSKRHGRAGGHPRHASTIATPTIPSRDIHTFNFSTQGEPAETGGDGRLRGRDGGRPRPCPKNVMPTQAAIPRHAPQ